MEEIFDIYTREGKYLGTSEKSVCHSNHPKGYHKPVWIWIINSKNEILVQKRAAFKKTFPNLWDMPSAGHVVAKESTIDGAIRETYEELGVKTTKEDYTFLFEYISDATYEIAQVYLLRLDLEIDEFSLQKEEVETIKWLSFAAFENLFYSECFVPFDEEYKMLILNVFRRVFHNYNIVLTSSGFNDINNYVSEKMKELFKEIAYKKKVMILSNAAPFGSGNYIARENVKDNFLKIGASKVDIIDLDEKNLTMMHDYDIIYGLGGNITYLIELNRTISFKEELIKFLKHGIYIGESAGSMILCDDLKWIYEIKKGTKPKYDVALETYTGLHITDYKVLPHWNKIDENIIKKVETFEKENNMKINRLKDGEYILTNYIEDVSL